MTETYNSLRNNAFTFNLLRLPETIFRVVSLDFPDVSIASIVAPLPGATANFPGHTLEFSDLSIRFICDEDMSNYIEIFNWITQQQFESPQYTQESELVSDGSVIVLNNSNVGNLVFMFKDLFPVSLSGPQFMTNVSAPDQVECTVSFKFSYFTINPEV